MTQANREPLEVLVVDDSAYNRRSISSILTRSPEVRVVGKAADGEEALRLASVLKPQVITLDLEMPKMDGFTFLRILMSKMPTPVIVVSSYSQKENVFRALELGALDFVAKPDRRTDAELQGIGEQLLSKVLMTRGLRQGALVGRPALEVPALPRRPKAQGTVAKPERIIAIASSTGGPSALMDVLARVPERTTSAVLVAQHMPDKFTRTFAERLNRRSLIRVTEAQEGDAVGAAQAFVCPGRRCMELQESSGQYLIQVLPAEESDRYVPSADRLFASVAKLAGRHVTGIILTGMGDDGVLGAGAILKAGGTVIAESELTAVVYGMPGAAVRAGVVSQTLPLPEIGNWLARQ